LAVGIGLVAARDTVEVLDDTTRTVGVVCGLVGAFVVIETMLERRRARTRRRNAFNERKHLARYLEALSGDGGLAVVGCTLRSIPTGRLAVRARTTAGPNSRSSVWLETSAVRGQSDPFSSRE
jgi:hypothetical protein